MCVTCSSSRRRRRARSVSSSTAALSSWCSATYVVARMNRASSPYRSGLRLNASSNEASAFWKSSVPYASHAWVHGSSRLRPARLETRGPVEGRFSVDLVALIQPFDAGIIIGFPVVAIGRCGERRSPRRALLSSGGSCCERGQGRKDYHAAKSPHGRYVSLMIRSDILLALSLLVACAAPPARSGAQVRAGVEVVLSDSVHLIAGKRLGLLTNNTGVDHLGRRDVDLLRTAAGSRLTVLFSPEHGFRGTEDRSGLPDGTDSATGLPIYSLYGGSRTAARAAVDSVDVLLIDLQDIGARYYTYIATTVQLMRDATRAGKRVIVLDRPDPVGGTAVQGNVRTHASDPDSLFSGFMPVPMRYGMTLGELARLANDALAVGTDLVVVPALGWTRTMFYDQTGLPWVKPSPNMPDIESALLYPGTCLFEGTNVSVGRGTPAAFRLLGAPWLDPAAVIERMRAFPIPGVDVTPTVFSPVTPTDGKYPGVPLQGVRFQVRDRSQYDPTRLAVVLLAAIRAAHPQQFQFRAESFDRLAAGPELRAAVEAGRSAREIWEAWEHDLARFRLLRAKYLIYAQ